MKLSALLFASLAIAACSSTPIGGENPSVRKTLAGLEERFADTRKQEGYVDWELEAADAENELHELAIDSILVTGRAICGMSGMRDGGAAQTRVETHVIACEIHVSGGYGRLMRFLCLADPVFEFQAAGFPTVRADTARGALVLDEQLGLSAIYLVTGSTLAPGVDYHLRARNGNASHRWAIADGLAIAR